LHIDSEYGGIVKTKWVTVPIIALIALLFNSFSIVSGPNAKTRLFLDYNPLTPQLDQVCPDIGEGSEVLLSVIIKDVKDLDGYALLFSFNSEALEFISAEKSISELKAPAFLESNGGRIGALLVKPGNGTLDIAASLIGTNRDEAPDGAGTIIYLRFKRITKGECGIKILEAEVIDSGLMTDKIISPEAAKAQIPSKKAKIGEIENEVKGIDRE